jgi:sterol 14-demethylase
MPPTLPPLLPGVPALGNGPAFLRDPMGTLWRGHRELGGVFGLRLGPKRAVVVTGPAESHAVVGLPLTTLSLRPVYRWVVPMFGEIMQAADEQEYAEQRAVMLPAFRGRHLQQYVTAMTLETADWLAGLGDSGRFDATRDIERLSMGIAVRAFLGPNFRQRTGEDFWQLYRDLADGMEILLPPNLPLPKFFRRDRARAKLFALLRTEVDTARTDPDPGRHGFLAHLAGGRYSDGRPVATDTAVGLVLSLVFAAYETTAAQLAWALVLLLQHPEELRLVTAEVDAGVPAAPADLTPTDLHRLSRLHWNLREAERLRPITTMLWRYTEQSYEVGGFTVPQGWFTVFCPPITHRDPDVFSSPDDYDPERFSPSRDPGGRAAGTLLNLGGGTHRCLGARFADMEMKSVISMLLQRYRLRLVNPWPAPDKRMGISRPASPCDVAYAAIQKKRAARAAG